ncbi:hypothetical protein LguiB_018462 [Lonicera macranthoides]
MEVPKKEAQWAGANNESKYGHFDELVSPKTHLSSSPCQLAQATITDLSWTENEDRLCKDILRYAKIYNSLYMKDSSSPISLAEVLYACEAMLLIMFQVSLTAISGAPQVESRQQYLELPTWPTPLNLFGELLGRGGLVRTECGLIPYLRRCQCTSDRTNNLLERDSKDNAPAIITKFQEARPKHLER